MDNATFKNILRRRLSLIKSTLAHKEKEYASSSDRLHNFKRAGDFDCETPERALWGMFKKHLVSLRDMIEDLEKWRGVPNALLWDEKIGDAINYLILLEALIAERVDANFDRTISEEPHELP